MILKINQIQTFTKHYFSDLSKSEFQEKQSKFIDGFAGFQDHKWIFYFIGENNEFLSFHIQQDHGNAYILFVTANRNFSSQQLFKQEFKRLIDEVIKFITKQFDIFTLESRCLGESDLSKAYPVSDFNLSHTRYEFKKVLDHNSIYSSETIEFNSYIGWGLSLSEVADIMTESAIGDPDFSEDDNALECLQSYLSDSSMYSQDDCIQVGKIDNEFMSLVIPQSDGTWGTLTYLGIIPKYRKRGLGKDLHKYGLSCLYKQGTRDYHGGTLETNAAMQRVFQINSCELYRYLEVWFYKSV
ncbi:MAG: GNAT family N-acetyltransferase [Candidatus Cloacimonetes bacterium]|nr:GNAT family N-acetyltransferase [Candidatus Cloacimonadota bacterium]